MFVVRGAAWALVLVSVVAVTVSAVLAGRSLAVDPDLGPDRTVVVPVSGRSPSSDATPASPPPGSGVDTERGGARREGAAGARTDPRAPLLVLPRDRPDADGDDDPAGDIDDLDDPGGDGDDLDDPDDDPDDPGDDPDDDRDFDDRGTEDE